MTTAPDLPAHGVQSAEDRLRISLRMIIQAREELKMGSRLQAGEKAWGAVVHPVKAIAQQRGWRHKSHQDVHAVMSQVVLEYGGGSIDRPDDKSAAPVHGHQQRSIASVAPAHRPRWLADRVHVRSGVCPGARPYGWPG